MFMTPKPTSTPHTPDTPEPKHEIHDFPNWIPTDGCGCWKCTEARDTPTPHAVPLEWTREAAKKIYVGQKCSRTGTEVGSAKWCGEKDCGCRECMTSHPCGDAAWLARAFHEAYERLALSFGYETRPESATSWENVPEANKRLMIATCAEVIAIIARHSAPSEGETRK